jgi:Zn ribbon nucleic-acid-binding protein
MDKYQSKCPKCSNVDVLNVEETMKTVHCQRCYHHYKYESEQHLLNLTTLELIKIIQDLRDENELLSEHCSKLEAPIINKVLNKEKSWMVYERVRKFEDHPEGKAKLNIKLE